MVRLIRLGGLVAVALGVMLAGACSGKTAGESAPSAEAEIAGADAVAKDFIEAFKAKDMGRLKALVQPRQRADFNEGIQKVLESDSPLFAAMRAWDGAQLEVRYAGLDARVHYGPADGRLAVLELRKEPDHQWYMARVRYSDAADFAAWGSTDPSAAVPPCNGGGKTVDTRPLPVTWSQNGGAPKGAVACTLSRTQPKRFHFELGSGPEEAAKAWRDHLRANGWRIDDVVDNYGITFKATGEGGVLKVFTSTSVEDLGWTTVTMD